MEKKQLEKIKELVSEKYISEQKHPEADLFIYNYTPNAQYDKKWNETTMMCRGLILDKDGNVVARPFKKFFNAEEHLMSKPIPKEPFNVTEKMDGSLGILYHIKDKPFIATRGSFVSEQAIKGTEILQKKYKDYKFAKDYTYLFEILYPKNRIVVDYKDTEDLILLAVVETKTGNELPLKDFGGFSKPKVYDGVKDILSILKLKDLESDNKEGFVVKFESGLRLKVKFEEYVRLHRLVTQTNKKRIWEHIKLGLPIDEIIEKVPDEFYRWVKNTIKEIEDNYTTIESEARITFNSIKDAKDRKTFARMTEGCQSKAILFRMLDKRDYSDIIWNLIKPKGDKPFKREI